MAVSKIIKNINSSLFYDKDEFLNQVTILLLLNKRIVVKSSMSFLDFEVIKYNLSSQGFSCSIRKITNERYIFFLKKK